MTTLEDVFVNTRLIAFERFHFICRKQKKTKSLEQFHADLVKLASPADCCNREDEWVRYMFTAYMNHEKLAKELQAQTRRPQDAYEYAIRREKRDRTQPDDKYKQVRRPNKNCKTRAVALHKCTRKIQPTKQPEYTERPGRLPRPTVSAWNPKHKGTTTTERKLEQLKTMLQMRISVHPKSPTIVPGKRQICSKCAKRGHFTKICRSTNIK